MRTWIPWEEIEAEWIKKPGFAEATEKARIELEAEMAAERTKRAQRPRILTTRRSKPIMRTAANVRQKELSMQI